MSTLQGWEHYVGFGNQSALGTKVDPTKFQHVDYAVSLKENQPQRTVVPGAIKGRFYVTALKGKFDVAGSVSMILRPDDYAGGRIWANLLPSNSVSGDAADAYTHTFSLGAFSDLPVYGETIQMFRGGSANTTISNFVGCFLKKLTMNVPEDGHVAIDTEWIGQKEVQGSGGDAIASPTYSDEPPFESYMLKVEIGATLAALSEVCVKDLTFEYDTMAKLLFQNCSSAGRYANGVSYGVPEVLVSFNKILESDYTTIYNYFKDNTENAVQITLTHSSLAGSNAGSEYEIVIKLPRVIWKGETPELSAPEDNTLSMNLQAIQEQSSYNYTCQIEVKNSESGTYTAS